MDVGATGKDALLAVIEYLTRAKAELSREQIETIVTDATPEVKEAFMTLADQLEEKGRREGEARGEARGKAEGKAETVLKQITLKFGAASETVQRRVRSASLEELDCFAERILFSTNVEQVLGD